jgi:catechol 2,3-dioxygenase-like lactoylglutathione lyase family enzyme
MSQDKPKMAREPQQGSKLKISETILKTSRIETMKAWYRTVLAIDPFFERTPEPGTKPLDLGGQTRASDLKMCFFRLSTDFPYVQTIGIFEEPGTSDQAPKGAPGLHHMQLMCGSVAELVEKYEELGGHGMRPHRSANHGPMTSFYYRDPDGNNVEITAQNYPSLDDMIAFMSTEAFKNNPSGAEIDPAEFVASFRAGKPVEELVKLPS